MTPSFWTEPEPMTLAPTPAAAPYGRSERLPDANEPPVPESVRDTGLSEEFIVDLLLKTLYVQGARTGSQLVTAVRLPFAFVDDRLLSLQQRRLVEVLGTSGPNRGAYVFNLTTAGPRPRPRGAGQQPVRGPRAGAAAAVPHLGGEADHPQRARDPRGGARRVQEHGAGRGRARRARPLDQLGQVALPLRRAGQRQDHDRRDHQPHAGGRHLRPLRGGGRRARS